MPNYRRNRAPGAIDAFTVNLRDRHSDLVIDQIGHLRAAVTSVRAEHPFAIDAWVILPDHMHCLWTLPPGDCLYPLRLQLIKGRFSQTQPPAHTVRPSLIRKGERGIWQRRYWEHTIRDDADFATHMDYIHFNPVKNTAMCARPPSGRIQPSPVVSRAASIRPIGSRAARNRRKPANATKSRRWVSPTLLLAT